MDALPAALFTLSLSGLSVLGVQRSEKFWFPQGGAPKKDVPTPESPQQQGEKFSGLVPAWLQGLSTAPAPAPFCRRGNKKAPATGRGFSGIIAAISSFILYALTASLFNVLFLSGPTDTIVIGTCRCFSRNVR